jgi:glycosyltransferase involved in cell wall biosynthesis
MSKILISTITPCFRMKRYLKKFLEELPKQTMFNNIEIVLDHNEPDEEEIILVREFQKKYPSRLKHIIIDKVDPIGISMNRCIRESSGEFLTVWNIDDLRTPNSIEIQYKKIIENNNFGIVYGDHMIVNSFGKQIGEYVDHSKYSKDDLMRAMLLGPFFMFRKSICNTAGFFDEQFKICADFDLAMRILLNTEAVYVKGLLGYYLDEGMGASTKPSNKLSPETTVISLRYGIFDKIDYDLVAYTTQYNIRHCTLDKKLIFVGDYIKNYNQILCENEKLIKKGIRLFIVKKITMFDKIEKRKKKFKKYIPTKLIELYKRVK